MNTTNPQPAKTPLTDALWLSIYPHDQERDERLETALGHARTLEHALAEREAEVAELKRRIEEQHSLYCEETKKHNETWKQIHAATAHLDKEFDKLPDGLLAKVHEVTFRVALVQMGRDSVREENATLRTSLRAAEERAHRAERDAQVANDIKTAEKKILIAEIEAHTTTKTRLATVADEIEKTGAVEALEPLFIDIRALGMLCDPEGRPTDGFRFREIINEVRVSLEKAESSIPALTALVAKLRDTRPEMFK